MFHYLPLLPGPQLTSLNLTLNDTTKPLNMLHMQMIPHLYPVLQEFTVNCDGDQEQLKLPLSLIIQSLQHLRYFTSSIGITADAIIHLSTLPSLAELSCVVPLDEAFKEGLHRATDPFPSLKILSLELKTSDERSMSLITAPGQGQLQTVSLYANNSTRCQLVSHLRGLQNHANSLQTLTLHFSESDSVDGSTSPQDSPSYKIDGRRRAEPYRDYA